MCTRHGTTHQLPELFGCWRPVESALAAATGFSPAARLASADDVQRTWEALGVNARRQVVDELMTVTLLPAGKGRRFAPEQVRMRWKGLR